MIPPSMWQLVCLMVSTAACGCHGSAFVPAVSNPKAVGVNRGRSFFQLSLVPHHTSLWVGRSHQSENERRHCPTLLRLSEANLRLGYLDVVNSLNATTDASIDEYSTGIEGYGKSVEEIKSAPETIRFVYGSDSKSYRGLVGPSKAGLVLAMFLSAGLAVASPELSLDVPAVPLDWSTFQDAMTVSFHQLDVMMDKLAFDLDMSGLPAPIHQIADNAVAQIGSQLAAIKSGVEETLAAFQVASGQMAANGKDFVTQQTSEWQQGAMQASFQLQARTNEVLEQAKIVGIDRLSEFQSFAKNNLDQLQLDSMRIAGHVQDQINQLVVQGKDFVSHASSEMQQATQLKMDELDITIAQVTNQLKGETDVFVNQGKETVTETLKEYQLIGRSMMEQQVVPALSQIQSDAFKLIDNAKALGLAETGELQRIYETLIGKVESDLQRDAEVLNSWMNALYSQGKEYSIDKATDLQQWTSREIEGLQKVVLQSASDLNLEISQMLEKATKESIDLQEVGRTKLNDLQLYVTRFVDQSQEFALLKVADALQAGETQAIQVGQFASQVASEQQTASNDILAKALDFGAGLGKEWIAALHNSVPQLNVGDVGQSLLVTVDELQDKTFSINEQMQASVGNSLSGVEKTLSNLNSATAQADHSSVLSVGKSVPTDSVFLKTILETMVN